jgi:spermidine/putrescine transport system permease protein
MTLTPAWKAFLAVSLAFMLGPLLLVVLFSFGRNALIGFPMGGLTFDWYRKLFDNSSFWDAFRTSLAAAAGSSLIATLTGTLCAFGLLQARRRLAAASVTFLSFPVLLPPLVVAIAIVVLIVRGLGLSLGLPVVILGHALVSQPFVLLIMMSRLHSFDFDTVESALDLGASRLEAFRDITLPQIRGALVGSALIAASISLDDFIIASFTIGAGNTLSTFVWGMLRTTLDPSINAIAAIILLLTTGTAIVALRLTQYRG